MVSAQLRPSSFQQPMTQLPPPGGRLGGALRCPGEWGRRDQGSPTARFCRAGPGRLASAAGAPEPLPLARLRVGRRRRGATGEVDTGIALPPPSPGAGGGGRAHFGGLGPIRVGKARAVYYPRPPGSFQGNPGVCWELSVLTASVIVISITARPSAGTAGSSLAAAFQL